MEEEVETPLPYKTVRQANAQLEVGVEKILQQGIDGILTTTYHVTYTDGVETSREEFSSMITTESTDMIIEYGTKVVEVKTETRTESVPYTTERVPSEAILEGEPDQVIQAGVNGVRTITYEVTYHNGVEASRRETGRAITTQPVTEIIHYGTGVPAEPSEE